MARRTPAQQIADLEQRLAVAKDRRRKARTHRLIVFGGRFADVLDAWDTLTPNLQDRLRNQICDGIRRAAGLAPSPPQAPPQPEPAPAGDGTLKPPT